MSLLGLVNITASLSVLLRRWIRYCILLLAGLLLGEHIGRLARRVYRVVAVAGMLLVDLPAGRQREACPESR